jgi:hypothetical protein
MSEEEHHLEGNWERRLCLHVEWPKCLVLVFIKMFSVFSEAPVAENLSHLSELLNATQ